MRRIHLATSRRDSRAVNQGYLSSNSAESSASRICPPDACSMPFMHPLSLPRNSQLEGQKGELISISRKGRVYSQTSLPPAAAAAGDGGRPNPCFRRCFFALSPFDSFSFSLSLLRSFSPLSLLPAFPTAFLTAPGPVIIFHLLVFIFFRLFSGALRGKR